MTDATIADMINRHVAQLVAQQLDFVDNQIRQLPGMADLDPQVTNWEWSALADTLMGDNASTNDGDRAWLLGMLTTRTPGVDVERVPGDADWENLFSHLRAEILARRDPQTPPVRAAIAVRDGVGS